MTSKLLGEHIHMYTRKIKMILFRIFKDMKYINSLKIYYVDIIVYYNNLAVLLLHVQCLMYIILSSLKA